MLRRERTCDCCGKVEFVFTRTDTCHECHTTKKRERYIAAEREKLKALYSSVSGPILNKHNQRQWTFIHDCGTEQTWSFFNVLKQLNLRPDAVPCKTCGGKERMSKAMAAFIAKYGLKPEQMVDWEIYRVKVRRLTEVAHKKHKVEINPLNLKRGTRTYHLDHRKPIIQCFLDGESPEFAARLENLEMLPAFTNLSKGRKGLN